MDNSTRAESARESANALYEKPIVSARALTSLSITEAATDKLIAAMDSPDRLVVFVGSGASAAYGQIDWTTLVENVVEQVASFRSEDSYDRQRNAELKDLWETMGAIDLRESTENKILALELAGRIVEILAQDGRTTLEIPTQDGSQSIESLKDIIAHETGGWKKFSSDRRKAIARAMSANLKCVDFGAEAFSSTDVFEKIDEISKEFVSSLEGEFLPFLTKCTEWMEEYQKKMPLFFHQDLVMAAICFSIIGIRLDRDEKAIELEVATAVKKRIDQASLNVANAKGPARSSDNYDLRCLHDPIRSLIASLDARRFITTNYDREIEDYFKRVGYKFDWPNRKDPPSATTVYGRDGTGSTVRSTVLTEDTVADLVEFAANAGQDVIDVFHLHGRNDLPKSIIATESDYRQVYLRDDRRKQLFDEALDVVFSGNTILFVGLGMTEADLLRPLRKFVGVRPEDRTSDSLIVLMPRTKANESEEAQRQLSLKVRYGVDTIIYGEKELAEVLERVTALRDVLKSQDAKPLDAELGHLDSGEWAGLEAHIEALNVLTDLFKDGSPERFNDIHRLATADDAAGESLNRLLHQFIDATAARVTTASLCDYLSKIGEESRIDFRLRRRAPEARDSSFPSDGKDGEYPVRHGIVEPESPADPPEKRDNAKGLLFKFAQYRFETLRSSIRAVPTCRPQSGMGGQRRRIFLIQGDRGVGRGRTFWRLHERDQSENRLRIGDQRYRHAFSANTSFSWEFASTFEKLIDFIGDGELSKGPAPRSKRLKYALAHARKKWTGEDDRHLFVLNGIDTLLDRHGNPFGDEYAELFRILLGPGASDVPLDIILLGEMSESVRTFLKRCLRGLKDDKELDAEKRYLSIFERRRADREPKTPSATLSELRRVYETTIDRWIDRPLEIEAKKPLDDMIDERLDPLARDAAILSLELKPIEIPRQYRQLEPDELDFADRTIRFLAHLPNEDVEMVKGEAAHASSTADTPAPAEGKTLDEEPAVFTAPPPTSPDATPVAISPRRDPRFDDEHRARCYLSVRRFRDAIDHTFAWSLVEQAISWLHETSDDKMEGVEPINAVKWLDNLTHRLLLLDATKRPEACCNAVIDFYEQQQKPHISRLRSSILKHLTIIGVPVEAVVLVRCPELQDIADDLLDSQRKRIGEGPREEVIRQALERLVDLHLVFQIDSNALATTPDPEDPREKLPRFAVHRLTQASILRRMGCPRVEGGETNFFQVTLYAAQPKDLPSLNPDSYDFVRRLIESLLLEKPKAFPTKDAEGTDGRRESLFGRIQNAARCHRAAFGAVRASWSLAVLSRLLEETKDPSAFGHGLLEVYKRRNLALIDRAKADDLAYEYLGIEDDYRGHHPLRAHYADEIVWIYNELGVTALTQGRPLEALPLFDSAAYANRRIEQTRENATWARVSLNTAVAMIEVGELRHARRLLEQIRAYEDRRAALIDKEGDKSLVATLAEGYLALMDHLAGRLHEADTAYKETIKELSRFERYRAVAIFCRHRSTLKARQNDTDKAISLINRSIRAAQAGRHQDILHLSRVNQCALEFKGDTRMVEAASWMKSADRYADYMGIPKLKVEVLFNRGRVFLDRGETKVAGECATKALAVASHYGMKLRKIAALMLLGEVTLERGNRDSARQIFISAQRLAEGVGYHLKGETAHQILLRNGLHPKRQLREL